MIIKVAHLSLGVKKAFSITFLSGLLLVSSVCAQTSGNGNTLLPGFSYLDEIIPDAIYDVRYYSENNFMGTRVDGYIAPKIILTDEAAEVLVGVARELRKKDLILKFFDGYRPKRAVNHFIRWAADIEDVKMKSAYYPDVDKKDLFRLHYIAKKSGHSRGSTIDLTLVDALTGKELDMASGF